MDIGGLNNMSLARYSNMQIGQKKSIIKDHLLITIDCIMYKLDKGYKVTISKIQAFNEFKYHKQIIGIKQLYSVICQDLSRVVL